ncbi:MAG: SUMF1/EgtB/PvdO family nonheme iron enzyme [Planctomycetota bacterium]
MSELLRKDLKARIAAGRVVVIAGAGVARAATPQAPGWVELLESGVRRCVDLDSGRKLPSGWAKRQGMALKDGDLDELLGVAEQVTLKLGGPGGGEYARWLDDEFRNLHHEDRSWTDALLALAVPILTTNYDDLLENSDRRTAVTWREPARLQEILQRRLAAIGHLHGHYSQPQSVVLGIRSYDEILAHEPTQALLHAAAALNSLLLIGFGAGLRDPNFRALRQWIARNFSGSKFRHYRLVREVETTVAQAEHEAGERIQVLPYGQDYTALPDFLKRLCPPRGAPRRTAAALPRRRDPLPLYLHQVRVDHDRLVPFFQDRLTNADLGTLYVELRLGAKRHELLAKPGTATSKPDSDGWSLREILRIDPGAVDRTRRRWVIRGDPGCGKTTLMRHLAWELAGESSPEWVPVYVRVRHLLEAAGGRGDPWKRIQALLQVQGHETDLIDALEGLREAGRLLVLLDGLDEAPRDKGGAARSLLTVLDQDLGAAPLVVSTRRIGYDSLGGEFQDADVLGLDRAARIELLGKCLQGRDATPLGRGPAEWLDQFARDPSLSRFAGNPLLLTLMALLLGRGEAPSSLRSELYAQVLRLLLEGKQRPEPEAIPCEADVRVALGCIAHGMTQAGQTEAVPSLLEKHLRAMRTLGSDERASLECLQAEPLWAGSVFRILETVANHTGILGPYDGREGPWRFWHRSFQEALTAERLALRGEEKLVEFAAQVQNHLDLWAEPFALATGMLAEPDRLVESLVKVNAPLGLRALATAQRVAPETILGVLRFQGRIRESREEERWEVYGRVLELIGDPERGLRLLDTLRRSTRNGADLYFIDQAFARAAEDHPSHAHLARGLARELFDGLPSPMAALPPTLRTCDGDVNPWVAIPLGRFRMGSTKKDRMAYQDEFPQHEVEIQTPFEMWAVPVTNGQYRAFDPEHESSSEPDGDRLPVVDVTWYEAVMFCRWLGARLPTEAEWEYACRAGTKTRYWSGDKEKDLARVGWYGGNSGDRLHVVGEKPANAFRLYDMHGNVWEWCHDEWSDSYEESRRVHPAPYEAEEGKGVGGRMVRGGSFRGVARRARSAYRVYWRPGIRFASLGFRPARVITE